MPIMVAAAVLIIGGLGILFKKKQAQSRGETFNERGASIAVLVVAFIVFILVRMA